MGGRAHRVSAVAGGVLGHHEASRPSRGADYELFVIIDIYSRHVVARTVVAAETGELAKEFIDRAITSQDVKHGQPTLHADPPRR